MRKFFPYCFRMLSFLMAMFASSGLYAQLSGTYTINPNGSGTRNYTSFGAAITALNANGISAPVTFNVANGTYNEQLTLKFVSGSSGSNPITFKGADSARAILKYNTSAAYDAVLKFNAAENFIFEGLTIEADNSVFGYAVHLTSAADSNTIRNCILKASTTTTSSSCAVVNVAGTAPTTAGQNGDDITIENCIIEGGYYGVNYRGTSRTILSSGAKIKNCTFSDQYANSIIVFYMDQAEIIGNTIGKPRTATTTSIYLYESTRSKVNQNAVSPGRNGLLLQRENTYFTNNSSEVINNTFSDFADAGIQTGIYSSGSRNVNFYHNTIRTEGTNTSNFYPSFYLFFSTDCEVKNNIIANYGDGIALNARSSTIQSGDVDYNLYHSSGVNLLEWANTVYSSLSSFQSSVSSQNANSKELDPTFQSKTNLRPSGSGANNWAAANLASVDILGNSRPKSPDVVADVGAIEFFVNPKDLDLRSVHEPIIASIGNNTVGAVFQNDGSQDLSNDTAIVGYKIGTGSWVKDTFFISSIKMAEYDTFRFPTKWNVTSSGTYDICVKVFENVSGDPDASDSICTVKCVGKKDTFVVDKSGNGDFTTIAAAVSSLSCGVSAPVVVIVKEGNYEESVEIGKIGGASKVNNITFIGEDVDKVIMSQPASGTTEYIISLKATEHISFRNITFSYPSAGTNACVKVTEEAEYIGFTNCKFLKSTSAVGFSLLNVGLLVGDYNGSSLGFDNYANHLFVDSCYFEGGNTGLVINGTWFNSTSTDFKITNSTFLQQYNYGAYVSYVSQSIFNNNVIKDMRYRTSTGLYWNRCNQDTIMNNVIQSGRFGIQILLENFYYRNNSSLVANNMISNLQDPNYQAGIFGSALYNVNFYHNSIWTSSNFRRFNYGTIYLSGPNNCNVKNNALRSDGSGHVFSSAWGNMSIGSIDYNNYYTSSQFARYYFDGLTFTDLATWKTISNNYNVNSLEGDPGFSSEEDLTANGVQLNNVGLSNLGIKEDIEGDKRPIFPDKKVDIGADEFYVSPYDLDIVELVSPLVPIRGDNAVRVLIKNTGSKELINDTIYFAYTVDGAGKVADSIIVNRLDPNDTLGFVFNTKWKVTTQKSYELCVELDPPFFGDPDTDDFVCRTMCPGVKDTFVIDRTGNGDFRNFRQAIASLDCGINRTTVFEVKPGTYNEHISIEEIEGASEGRRIIFDGLDKSQVTLSYDGNVDSPAVVWLKGADYVTFKNFTITSTRTFWASGVQLSEGADYNRFEDIDINLPTTATNLSCSGILLASGTWNGFDNNANYNEFDRINFNGGAVGAILNGVSFTSLCYGNSIKNSSFNDQFGFGIRSYYQGELTIENCVIDTLRSTGVRYGFYNYYSSATTFNANKIYGSNYAIYCAYENRSFDTEISYWTNNMFAGMENNTTNYGMYCLLADNNAILHNSFNFNKGGSGSCLFFSSGSGHNVQNNVFSKSTTAYFIQQSNTSFVSVNYNNYYAGTSGNFASYNGSNFSNMSEWRADVNGQNANSKVGDPEFESATDLHIKNTATQLSNWGNPLASVDKDYDGEIRNPTVPDIGADEYSAPFDIGISKVVNPLDGCELTEDTEVGFRLKNYGTNTIAANELITVYYSIDGAAPVMDTLLLSKDLKQNDTLDDVFAIKGDFKAKKDYTLQVWTAVASDTKKSNDTLEVTIKSFNTPTADFGISGFCSKDDITFSDSTKLSSGSISSYSWRFGDGGTSTAQNPKHRYSVNGSYTVSLKVETNDGCEDSTRKTIQITTKPDADFDVQGGCLGDSISITNRSSNVTANGVTYKWDFGDGKTSSLKHPKHLYATAGSYTIELVNISAGCSDTVEKVIVMSAKPQASFTISDVCLGDDASVNESSTIPNGSTAGYRWTMGDGNTLSTQNINYKYASLGRFKVLLRVSLNSGCFDTTSTYVRVTDKPNPDFSVNNACDGDSVAFTDASTISLENISGYAWSFGDNKNSTVKDPKHLYGAKGTYNVRLITTSQNGCVDSIKKDVTIYEKPVANFTVAEVCDGDSTGFTDGSSVGTGSITGYSWQFGDGFSASIEKPKHKYATSGSYNATLIASSNNGCTDTITKALSVNPLPTVDFDYSNVCFGDDLSPTNNSSISSGTIDSYEWSFGDGGSSTATSPTYKYSAKGTYDLKLVAESDEGCKDSLTQQVVVDSKIVPDFNFTSACKGDTVYFTNTTNLSCGTISSYSWTFGDGNSSSSASPKHKYANSGNYQVELEVTESNGTKTSITKTVAVDVLPSVSFVASNDCQDEDITFLNTSSISSGSIGQYTWDFGDGNKSSAQSPDYAFSAAGSYTVKLIASSAQGCVDSASRSITIYELPNTDFTAGPVCLGKAVEFKNNSTISSGTLSYSWDFGDGFSSGLAEPKYTYATAKTYTVILTSTSTNNCSSKDSLDITVQAAPTAGFTFNDTCANDEVRFKNTSSISAGTLNYKWKFGDGDSSSAQSPNHIYTGAGTYSVTLSVVSSTGCSDDETQNVRVFPTPTPNFLLPGECSGTTVTLNNTSSISSGTLSYSWDFGDGSSSTATSPTHTFGNNGNYSVRLLATSNQGCVDSVTKVVRANSTPDASFTFSNGCNGDEVGFSNTSTVSSGAYSSVWYFGDSDTSRRKSPGHIYSTAGTYTVKLVIQSGTCKDSTESQIVIHPKPDVDFTSSGSCLGQDVRFINATTLGSGTLSYVWRLGDGLASTRKDPVHSYSSAKTYQVTLVATSNRNCVDSITKNVTINEVPDADFTAAQACLGDSTSFTNTSIGTGGALTYRWDFGDGSNTSNLEDPKHLFASTQTYDVQLIALASNNGCVDTVTKSISVDPKPLADFSSIDACEDDTVFFTNSSSISQGTLSYTWDLGNTVTSTVTSPEYVYANDGNYVVQLVALSDKGCTDTLLKTVSVYAKPQPAFVSNDLCGTDNIGFTNNSSPSSGLTFEWSYGDGNSSTQKDGLNTFSSLGTYQVRLIAITGEGCRDTVTNSITLNELPKAEFDFVAGCEADSVAFTNRSTIGTGTIPGNLWRLGDGKNSLATSLKHKYIAGSYNVQLLVVSDRGCADSITKVVEVLEGPKASFAFNTVCKNDTVRLLNTSTGPGVNTYEWDLGNGSSMTSENVNIVYNQSGPFDVRLIVRSGGCADTMTQAVSFHDHPTAGFTVGPACEGEASAFRNASLINSGTLNYEWIFGDGQSSNLENPFHFYSQDATYSPQLVAISDLGCRDTASGSAVVKPGPELDFNLSNICAGKSTTFINKSNDINSLSFTWVFFDRTTSTDVNPSKTYDFAGEYPVGLIGDFNGCEDSIYRIITIYDVPEDRFNYQLAGETKVDFFSNDTSVYDYEWQFGDGNSSNIQNPQHTYADYGTYTVRLKVTNEEGCEEIFTKTVRIEKSVSIDDVWLKSSYSAYPNPFATETNIAFTLPAQARVRLEVRDMVGRVVSRLNNGPLPGGEHKFIFNASDVADDAGVYLVILEVDGVPYIKRISQIR